MREIIWFDELGGKVQGMFKVCQRIWENHPPRLRGPRADRQFME